MKKLNRKGYMTVEIIIASVIAFAIAFFLMEITFKLVDITDNEYVSTNFMTDKALIMKNIRENIQNDIDEYEKVYKIECNNNICSIIFDRSGGPTESRRLIIDNQDDTIMIKYTENSDNGKVLYSKELSSGLSNVSLSGNMTDNHVYVYFQIKGDNIFSNETYDINIIVYNG